MEQSDDSLVSLAGQGDDNAMTLLLQRHGPAIRARLSTEIRGKWQSVLDADDVMQITYLEAYLRIDRFEPRGEGSFAAWLTHIAKNNLRDAIEGLERQKRPPPDARVLANPDESAAALFDQLACTTTTPSRQAGRKEILKAVHSAITTLPDDYATVVKMYDLEGRTVGEVAETMGRTSGAVYMLRARAHDLLRETLGSASAW
jgi:RNA polymerase sigma-70 factor (ECF subfamily)